MARFLIKRRVGDATQDDIDAAVVRAVTCAYSIEGLRWITSYWDKAGGYTYCVYEAADEAEIREHSRRASINCDEITEVESIDPSQYGDSRAAILTQSGA